VGAVDRRSGSSDETQDEEGAGMRDEETGREFERIAEAPVQHERQGNEVLRWAQRQFKLACGP